MPSFPKQVMYSTRAELDGVRLSPLEGTLPTGMSGSLFFNAPVGTDPEGARPYRGRPSVVNGDGMTYRIDFEEGEARATSRIVKAPDYYADQATRADPSLRRYRFSDYGILRGSRLGTRNYGNTAPLPLTQPGAAPDRLLTCYDAGRPLELDPATLETVTTVGSADEWRALALGDLPFPPIMTSAHPVWDPHTAELLSVNYGQSSLRILASLPGLWAAARVPLWLEHTVKRYVAAYGVAPTRTSFWRTLADRAEGVFVQVARALGVDAVRDFLYLMRWDGHGRLERWRVVLPDGAPARIRESVHQLAVTEHYVVVMDTAFKVRLDTFLSERGALPDVFESMVHATIATPQTPEAHLMIVPRAALVDGDGEGDPWGAPGEAAVRASTTRLTLSSTHFLADYDDRGGEALTLHVGHGCALDLAECIRGWDSPRYDGEKVERVPEHIVGMVPAAMDVSRVGRYRIRPSDGRLLDQQVIADDELLWGLALYTAWNVPTWSAPPRRIEHVYWFSVGVWEEMVTDFIYEMYADYDDRLVALEQFDAMVAEGGRPSTLFRVDTHPLAIGDSFVFPRTHTLSSPQFVPRSSTSTGQKDGWIVTTVWTDDTREIWVFDATDLAQGPVCRLGHPELGFGFSMHTAWMPAAEPRVADYRVDVEAECRGRLGVDPRLRSLFEQQVYPHFEGPLT